MSQYSSSLDSEIDFQRKERCRHIELFFGSNPIFSDCAILKVSDLSLTSRVESLLRVLDHRAFDDKHSNSLSQLYFRVEKYVQGKPDLAIPNKFINSLRLQKKCQNQLMNLANLLIALCFSSQHRGLFVKSIMDLGKDSQDEIKRIIEFFRERPKLTDHDSLLAKIQELEQALGAAEAKIEELQSQKNDLAVKEEVYEKMLKEKIAQVDELKLSSAAALDEFNEKQEEMEQQLAELKRDKLAADQLFKEKERELRQLTREFDRQQGVMRDLQDMVGQRDDEIQSLKDQYENLENSVRMHQSEMKRKNQRMSERYTSDCFKQTEQSVTAPDKSGVASGGISEKTLYKLVEQALYIKNLRKYIHELERR